MPITNIYRRGSLLETKEFKGHFYILKPFPNSKELIGQTDEEQEQSPLAGAVIVIWLKGAFNDYRLSLVPPDWHLQIDDVECEAGIYVDIVIKWRKVKLNYHEYAFEFTFDQQGFEDMPPPQPVSRQLSN